jgi:hypothetical protein
MLSLLSAIVITVISNDVIQQTETAITPRGETGLINFPIKQSNNNKKETVRSDGERHGSWRYILCGTTSEWSPRESSIIHYRKND